MADTIDVTVQVPGSDSTGIFVDSDQPCGTHPTWQIPSGVGWGIFLNGEAVAWHNPQNLQTYTFFERVPNGDSPNGWDVDAPDLSGSYNTTCKPVPATTSESDWVDFGPEDCVVIPPDDAGEGDYSLVILTAGHYFVGTAAFSMRGTFTLGPPPNLCDGNQPPVADFFYTAIANSVTVQTGGSSDPDNEIWELTRRVDWGDGTHTDLNGGQPAATHDYGATGTFTITVTVTDPCGASDATSDTVEITTIATFPPPADSDPPREPPPVEAPEGDTSGLSCPIPVLTAYSAPCGLDVSDALKAHLAQSPTTLCVCWRVERTDGVVYGFTSHVRNLTIDTGRGDELYKSSLGMTPSGFQNSENLTVDNMEVQAIFDDDAITDRDLLAGLFDDAEVEIFLVNYADLSMGRLMGPRGHLGVTTRRNGHFIAEHRALSQKLNANILPLTSARCRVKKLGDAQCKVDLTGLTVDGYKITAQGWVTSATTRALFLSNFSSAAAPPYEASQLYVWNTVEFTSGNNDHKTFSLVSFDGSKGVIHEDDLNKAKSIKDGDEGILHATRISDSADVDFPFTVTDAVNNGIERSFHVKSSLWGDTPPANEDTYPEGHFAYGTVTFTSGANHGIAREVKSFGSSGFEMAEAFPFVIESNDHFVAIAGCDRRHETCIGKYNNIINNDSEYTVPGIEKIMEVKSE